MTRVHPVVSFSQSKTLTYKIKQNSNEVSCREKIENDQNDSDERITSVGSKGSDTVASTNKQKNVNDGITSVQVSGLVDRIEQKESATVSNSKTVHQHNKTTLRSRKKSQGNLAGGKTMFSRVAKQGLLALGRGNDETHYSGSEKYALPVVIVGIKSRKKRQTNIAGAKPARSEQMREVRKPRGPASGKIHNNTNTVGLEKVVPPVPARKSKVSTTILRAVVADGRFKKRLSTPWYTPRHVAAKDKFGRSQNGALAQGVKSTQHYGKQFKSSFRITDYLARMI